jgi:hypothetical protein
MVLITEHCLRVLDCYLICGVFIVFPKSESFRILNSSRVHATCPTPNWEVMETEFKPRGLLPLSTALSDLSDIELHKGKMVMVI